VTFAHDGNPWFVEALEQRIGRGKPVGESRLAIEVIGVIFNFDVERADAIAGKSDRRTACSYGLMSFKDFATPSTL
jgi:hypothetical protein